MGPNYLSYLNPACSAQQDTRLLVQSLFKRFSLKFLASVKSDFRLVWLEIPFHFLLRLCVRLLRLL